jgi:hypothetical protein
LFACFFFVVDIVFLFTVLALSGYYHMVYFQNVSSITPS